MSKNLAVINNGATKKELNQGDKVKYAGFDATIVRHYSGNMYEIRTAGGVCCVDAHHFIQGDRDLEKYSISLRSFWTLT